MDKTNMPSCADKPLKAQVMKLIDTRRFKVFLALVAVDFVYSAAKEFVVGFQMGVASIIGG